MPRQPTNCLIPGRRDRGGRSIVKRVLPALVLALLGTLLPGALLLAPQGVQAAVGELIVLKGQATVFRGGREITVRRRLVLEAEDRVRTAPASKVHLRFHAPLKGSDVIATNETEFQVHALTHGAGSNPLRLVWGALRSRLVAFSRRTTYMQTGTAVIGVKGTDFIVYVKRDNASEFIGVDGLIEAVSRSRPEYSIRIGKRQWGEIVAGEQPKPPIRVPDELWFAALQEFSFPGEAPPAQ